MIWRTITFNRNSHDSQPDTLSLRPLSNEMYLGDPHWYTEVQVEIPRRMRLLDLSSRSQSAHLPAILSRYGTYRLAVCLIAYKNPSLQVGEEEPDVIASCLDPFNPPIFQTFSLGIEPIDLPRGILPSDDLAALQPSHTRSSVSPSTLIPLENDKIHTAHSSATWFYVPLAVNLRIPTKKATKCSCH
jgi:hypothetical protein